MTSARAITVGLVTTMFLTQAIPALSLLRAGGDVPLALAFRTVSFLFAPILLAVLDGPLARRGHHVLSRTLLGGAVVVAAGAGLGTLLGCGLVPGVAVEPGTSLAMTALVGAGRSVLVVGVWTLVTVLPRTLAQEKLRELQVANLELEASQLRTQGELARLRGQLEPHFLLNTLNLISGLVGLDTERARHTIATLGDLLRDALEPHGEDQSIHDEIRWLEKYAEILVARHGPALAFDWVIDEDARELCVPRLLLQPLVENAIVHGALHASDRGLVTVRVARAVNDRLTISVEDNGPGVPPEPRGGAVGIANVRRRLELTRPDATFELLSTTSGTCARLTLLARPH